MLKPRRTHLERADTRDTWHRVGWSRIELLVGVVVVLTVIGFVVTLISYSRGPTQQLECAMNLKRIGSAVHAFELDRKTLPSSCIAPGYATWAVQIAPFLEKDLGKPLKTWDFGLTYSDQPSAVREGQVWLYYCPARRQPGQLSVSGDVALGGAATLPNLPGALGDYGCSPTSDNAIKPWNSPEADGALIVGEVLEKQGDKIVKWKSRVASPDLKRGQSYTILLGEKNVPLGDFGQASMGDGSIYNGGSLPSFARLIDAKHALSSGPSDPFNFNFGSWHQGVCQFLMADGSLKIVRDDHSPGALQMLVPRGERD